MSEEIHSSSKTKSSSRFNAVFGVLLVVAIALLLNYLVGMVPVLRGQVDLTENKIYTLSEGTKRILARIPEDRPVSFRYYATRDSRVMPEQLADFSRNVENLLQKYIQAADGKIRLQKLDPRPDTDAEDSAVLDQIEARSQNMLDPLRLGLAVSSEDKTMSIPFIAPERETLLEYDISRLISEVIAERKPVLGMMTPLSMQGDGIPAQYGGKQPWYLYSELERFYEIRNISKDVEAIDPQEIEVLMLVHPADLTVDSLKAVDEYLIKGGKLFVCVDPHCIATKMDQPQRANPQEQQASPVSSVSNLGKLFSAWGVSYIPEVVIDSSNHTVLRDGSRMMGLLTLGSEYANADEVTTSQLNNLMLVFSGGFLLQDTEGIEKTVLLRSSENSQLVLPNEAESNSPEMFSSFQADGTEKALAVALRGNFTSAYTKKGSSEGSKNETEVESDSLTEQMISDKESSVILFADADWMHNNFSVELMQMMGQFIARPLNDNLSLALNCIEQLAGDSDLVAVRSRSSTRRPFTKIKELEAMAQQKFQSQLSEFEAQRDELTQEIEGIVQAQAASGQVSSVILSAEQEQRLEDLREQQVDVAKKFRQTKKELRKDVDSLKAKLSLANIFIMPSLVALVGIFVALYRRGRTAAR